jgi:ribonuclease P protein component
VKRVNSLKGRNVFQEVFKNGRKSRRSGITVFVLRDKRKIEDKDQSEKKTVKIGISIGRRAGKACKRNLLKRRIRVVCNELIDQINNEFLIIIKPGSGSDKLSFEDLRSEIITIFRNAGVINGSG